MFLFNGGLDRLAITGKFKRGVNGEYIRNNIMNNGYLQVSGRIPQFYFSPVGLYKYNARFLGDGNEDFSFLFQWGGNTENVKDNWRVELSPKNISESFHDVFEMLRDSSKSKIIKYKKDWDNENEGEEQLQFLPNVTRFDLAVDVPYNINFLDIYYSKLGKWSVFGAGVQVETKNFGSRSSERYFRIYDKCREMGIPGNVTRFEVEIKNKKFDISDFKRVDLNSFFDDFIVTTKEELLFWGLDLSIAEKALYEYVMKNPLEYSRMTRAEKEKLKRIREFLAKEKGKQIEIVCNEKEIKEEFYKMVKGWGLFF